MPVLIRNPLKMPNLWIVLFAATVSQGYFLSLTLGLKSKWKIKAVNVLSLLVLCFTITLTYYLAFWLGYTHDLHPATALTTRLPLLFGPLLWVYLIIVQKKKVDKVWLHFIPFALTFLAIVFSYGSNIYNNVLLAATFFQNVHLVAYSTSIIVLANEPSLKILAYTFAGYVACFIAYYIMAWTGILQLKYDYMVSLGMSVFIYYLGYRGLKSSQVLPEENVEKYSNSTLTRDALIYIVNKLDQVMKKDKLYVNGDLKLQDLANTLDVSVHSLSQAINSGKNQKFNDYLNELRVQEAQRLMTTDSYKNLKLIAIALDSGFNNKTSFLNAFKKHTGYSPSEYREKLFVQAS